MACPRTAAFTIKQAARRRPSRPTAAVSKIVGGGRNSGRHCPSPPGTRATALWGMGTRSVTTSIRSHARKPRSSRGEPVSLVPDCLLLSTKAARRLSSDGRRPASTFGVAQMPAAQRVGLFLRIEAGARLCLPLGGQRLKPRERIPHGVLQGPASNRPGPPARRHSSPRRHRSVARHDASSCGFTCCAGIRSLDARGRCRGPRAPAPGSATPKLQNGRCCCRKRLHPRSRLPL